MQRLAFFHGIVVPHRLNVIAVWIDDERRNGELRSHRDRRSRLHNTSQSCSSCVAARPRAQLWFAKVLGE
jgi:hypothetical protein